MKNNLFGNSGLCSLAAAIACVVSANPLYALDGAPEQNKEKSFALEEVTVTARKREESLQDTPISVSAFTANDMDLRQVDATDKLTQITPNLQFSSFSPSAGNNASSQVFIRGIGQTDFLPSTDPGVGIYVDGVYMARSVGGTLNFLDLERIEVLRGPQGTLFGRNTIGGAINIHSRKPAEEFGGRVQAKIGSDQLLHVSTDMDLPVSDTLLTKVSIGHKQQDGYVERNFDDKMLGDTNNYSVRASALWIPADDFEAYFVADYSTSDENGSPLVFNSIASNNLFARVSSARAGCPAPGTELDDERCANNRWQAGEHANNGTFPVKSEYDVSGVGVTLTWDLEWMTVKSISSYREGEWIGSRDADNTPFTILHTQNIDAQRQYSQEFQFSGATDDGSLNWLLGLYYFSEHATDDQFTAITFGDFNIGGIVDNDSAAIFSQATYELQEDLRLTLGLRYSEESKRFTPIQYAITDYTFPVSGWTSPVATIGPGDLFYPIVESEHEISKVTPMVNLSYDLSPDTMAYASFTKGFKSGGFNARNIKPEGNPDDFLDPVKFAQSHPREFEPEFAETYEIGFKTQLLDDRLRLNGALFHTTYSDLQFVIREDFAPITFNAGEAIIQGAELEWTLIPTDEIIITGGLGFLDASYEELGDKVLANGGVSLENDLPHAPEWSLNSGIAYRFDLGSVGTLTPRIDWSYHSKIYFNGNNTEAIAQDGYSVFNAAVIFETADEALQVSLGISNLTDESYRLAGNSSLEASASYAESVYARPREWTLSSKYEF